MPFMPLSGATCFTDWRPNCESNEELLAKMNSKNGHTFREDLQRNSKKIIEDNRENVACVATQEQPTRQSI